VVASLQTKANAITVLKSRLDLLSSYLKSLPPSYLTDASISPEQTDPPLKHEILRSISALAAQLHILSPADLAGFAKEVKETKTDVELIKLLSTMTRNVSDVKQLGKRWHLIEPRKRGSALAPYQPNTAADVPPMEWPGNSQDDMMA
jgi:COP9 signalosome complex subunit 6